MPPEFTITSGDNYLQEVFAMMKEVLRKAELFRNDCLKYDIPRLKEEVLPDDVSVLADIDYMGDENDHHLMDVYYTGSMAQTQCYILIHGGAFVYGDKKLDKNFGMRLAKASEIPVVNINYTLMPEGSINTINAEIDAAVEYVRRQYGFGRYHFVGDSAGGYLAVLSAMRHRDDTLSVSPVCGCYTIDRNDFPGALFAGAGEEIPEEYYDLKVLADMLEQMDVAIITGDDDFLREDNRALAALIPHAEFYDAVSAGGRVMTHVFPIGHPDWPEGQKAIDIIASFARKSC